MTPFDGAGGRVFDARPQPLTVVDDDVLLRGKGWPEDELEEVPVGEHDAGRDGAERLRGVGRREDALARSRDGVLGVDE